jgi:hypothetical protein
MIVDIDRDRKKIVGSHRAIYPENDPWSGVWQLEIGDTLDAKVVRLIEHSDRCGDAGGYLLALRPGAYVALCNQPSSCFLQGDECTVMIKGIDRHRHAVGWTGNKTVSLASTMVPSTPATQLDPDVSPWTTCFNPFE